MAEKPQFTQENVDNLIEQIKSLPEHEREQITNEIKADLRGWLLETFEFTPNQVACMEKWPQSMREETGFGIGTALLYEEWNLRIIFPEDPDHPVSASKPKKHEQSVSGSYNTQTGAYTVTKTHKWSW